MTITVLGRGLRQSGLRFTSREAFLGWWIYPRWMPDEAIREALRLSGYSPSGFDREEVSAYRAWRRVDPITITRRGSRALVRQEGRIYQ